MFLVNLFLGLLSVSCYYYYVFRMQWVLHVAEEKLHCGVVVEHFVSDL